MTAYDHLPPEVRNKLEETLDWFDAEKAARVYQLLGWKWPGTAEINGDGIPHAVEIRRMARSLAAGAYKYCEPGSRATHSSGGLKATVYLEDGVEFQIEFVAVEA
jgi:hypothetical protein